MDITDIKVFPVDEDKLKAYVTIVFDGCFMVSDIKVINGTNGLFVSMPSKRRKNGSYRDVAHPLNSDTRRMIEERILAKYEEALASGVSMRTQRTPREADSGLEDATPAPYADETAAERPDVVDASSDSPEI